MLSSILLDLSLGEVLSDIPHDTGAIVVYVLLLLFVALTWSGSRKRKAGGGRPQAG